MRDVRDRMARRRDQWREVGFAGMIGGDRRAMVMVSHEGVGRCEVLDVLRRRWPEVLVKKLPQEEPTWEMLSDDAAELGRCRRGVEPLRIVVMPQQEREVSISYRTSVPWQSLSDETQHSLARRKHLLYYSGALATPTWHPA